MSKNLSKERVEELREHIRTGRLLVQGYPGDVADLLVILDDYERFQPLIEAAEGAKIEMRKTYIEGTVCRDENCPLLRAALKCRAEKREEEKL